MRDKAGGKMQVTIMNDRPQGGSADLTDKATIELMQNRRQVQADPKFGFDEALNETNIVTATYLMHIFDSTLGRSLQREQQVASASKPLYYFVFDYPSFGGQTA